MYQLFILFAQIFDIFILFVYIFILNFYLL